MTIRQIIELRIIKSESSTEKHDYSLYFMQLQHGWLRKSRSHQQTSKAHRNECVKILSHLSVKDPGDKYCYDGVAIASLCYIFFLNFSLRLCRKHPPTFTLLTSTDKKNY